jgi:predicted ABC-type ATPase
MNSYYASVLSDFLRRKLLAERTSFSFETVMSEPGKVQFLGEALNTGFRTYLYFVATDDVQINIARVARRVAQGGHSVPADKIESRYQRSLSLALDAVRNTSRAFFFDTSRDSSFLVAESENGNRPTLRCDEMPNWFKTHIWDKF